MENSFNDLIDRLAKCSAINHPDRPWSEETRVNIAFAWIGKEAELLQLVEKLEKEIRNTKQHLTIVK